MRNDHRQRNRRASSAAAASVASAQPMPPPAIASCPPVIEEWLRASRARLLRRYGGVVSASAAGTRRGR